VGQRFIYELSWKFQKFFRKRFKIILLRDYGISWRKSQISSATMYKQLPEKIVFLHYKKNPNQKRSIIGINNVTLNPKSGVLWHSKRIIEESTVWHVSDLYKWEPTPLLAKYLPGKFVNLPDNSFYHFLIEDLPRFLDVIHLNSKATTIYGSNSMYITETLELLRIQDKMYIPYPIMCEELILSEKTFGGIFTSQDHKKLLNFSKNISANPRFKKIFIGRKNKSKGLISRGIDLTAEIESLFSRKSFKVVYLEDLNLVDQISIARGADVIAGFHGAGLAHMIWQNSSCKVIEISETRMTSHFSHLARVCGHQYVFCKSSDVVKFSLREFSTLITQ